MLAWRFLPGAVLFCLISAPAICAETAKPLVQPLGEFARIRSTEDHTYGHRVRLWFAGGQLLGEITHWGGNLEGESGRFTDGAYSRRTGEVKFTAVVIRTDLQPNVRTAVSFSGFLIKSALGGTLTWTGEASRSRGTNGLEEVVLPFAKGERLESYADVKSWRAARGMGEN